MSKTVFTPKQSLTGEGGVSLFTLDIVFGVVMGWMLDLLTGYLTYGMKVIPQGTLITFTEGFSLGYDDLLAMGIPVALIILGKGSMRRISVVAFWTIVAMKLHEYSNILISKWAGT